MPEDAPEPQPASESQAPQLKRELRTFGAVMMGLGSIIGTGVFVTIGIAAGVTGPAVVLAIAAGGVVALFNGLSSAQLAAAHPVSGGTYEYGYRYLNSYFGFTAGWVYLLAKSASGATAALGFGGYLLSTLGVHDRRVQVVVAVLLVVVVTSIVLSGIRPSNRVNVAVVAFTLACLAFFVAAGFPKLLELGSVNLTPFFVPEPGRSVASAFLYGTALMFVAFTGYGRIATLGEEVVEPRKTIPRAILTALGTVLVVYILVALVAAGSVGSARLGDVRTDASPLLEAARTFGVRGLPTLVALGALAAFFGVLLNLILGLSRVLFAMGRRRDAPRTFSRLNVVSGSPTSAIVATAVVVAAMAATGSVKTTWSFSAFAVLIYYAITNLACLRLPAADRSFPRWLAVAGLVCCVGLAFFVEPTIWLVGSGLIAVGLAYHALRRRHAAAS